MIKPELSILIPSRNEIFLKNTVEDILSNVEGDTEVIVVLDGSWANPPLVQNNRVKVIYNNKSLGQRGATNQACKLSTAKFVMKCDAHCAFDKGFDVKMMAEMHDDWTMVPRMYNLHAFNWKCPDGHIRYQSPSGPCQQKIPIDAKKGEPTHACGLPTTMDMIWKPRLSRKTEFWMFDKDLHFQYWGELGRRPESQGDIAETMSLLGACWMLTREKYWELNICDERTGSWGQQGTEVACTTWLTGGRLVINKKTWFSHMFRTQGGDFGFPYPNPGISQARAYSRDLWFNNKYPKQIHPLSWLIEKFWPIPGWDEKDLNRVKELGSAFKPIFSTTNPLTQNATPISGAKDATRSHEMSSLTEGFSSSEGILPMSNQSDMKGVTTSSVVADKVVKLKTPESIGDGTDQPSVHKSMDSVSPPPSSTVVKSSISSVSQSSIPIPAPSSVVDLNFGEKTSDSPAIESGNREKTINRSDTHNIQSIQQNTVINNMPIRKPTKGILYFTDGNLDSKIMLACQKQLLKMGLPILNVSLKPVDFGVNIVLPLERGLMTLFKQILVGLELMDTDIVFPVDHDVLYHTSHFHFTAPKEDVYYYNTNEWKIRVQDGFALHYDCMQHHAMTCYRKLLLEHYRKRVAVVEKNGGKWDRRIGFEPGSHHRKERLDDYRAETWVSRYPNLDIRHDANNTANRWRKDQFRDQRNCQNWIEAWGVPHWGITKGDGFNKILEGVINGTT